MILPFYVWETVQGGRIQGGAPVWLAMGYIAVFPSFIAYLFFNRGIELIGAARAGQSWHLMPLFGSILAVAFLGGAFPRLPRRRYRADRDRHPAGVGQARAGAAARARSQPIVKAGGRCAA